MSNLETIKNRLNAIVASQFDYWPIAPEPVHTHPGEEAYSGGYYTKKVVDKAAAKRERDRIKYYQAWREEEARLAELVAISNACLTPEGDALMVDDLSHVPSNYHGPVLLVNSRRQEMVNV